jgi:hypothetical protein
MLFTQTTVHDLLVVLNIVTMSDCFGVASGDQQERSKSWLNVLIEWVVRLPNLLHPDNPHFIYLDPDSKFQSLYFPALHAASNKKDKSCVVASVIDPEFNIKPVVLDLDLLKTSFLSICSQGEAIKYNLPYSKSDFLEACKFPEAGPPASTWFKLNGFPNFDLANASTVPVVAAFPKVLVTQTGSLIPVNVPASQDDTDTATDTDKPINVGTELPLPAHELVWYKAMAFSATHFGGGCLFEATTKSDSFAFNWSKLDLKVFHELFFSKEVCFDEEEVPAMAADHKYYQMYMSLAYKSFGTLLTKSAEGAAAAAAAATAAKAKAVTAPPTATTTANTTNNDPAPKAVDVTGAMGGDSTGDVPDSQPAVVQLPHGATIEQLLLALTNSQLQANAARNNPTEAPDSSLSKPDEFTFLGRQSFYQFFFASVHQGVVILAVFNQLFETLLHMTKKTSRLQQLVNMIRSFQATYGSPPGVSAFRHASGAGQLLDQPFANTIFHTYWMAQMTTMMEGSEYFLLFGSFGPPPSSMDPTVNKRKRDELLAQRQRDNKAYRAHIRNILVCPQNHRHG